LEEELYMEQPEGFVEEGKEGLVCKLKVSLYGSKQGVVGWNRELDGFMTDTLGWRKITQDVAVYFKKWDDRMWAIVGYWVDDTTGVGDANWLRELEKQVDKRYGTSGGGELSWMLGMAITRDRASQTIVLSQSAYIEKLVEKFGLTDATPVSTPFVHGIHLTKDMSPKEAHKKEEMAKVPYCALVGSLMYLRVCTRPDISYHVGVLSKFLDNPGREHWDAAKRVLKFLKGTKDWKLKVGGYGELRAYSDADWGGDKDTRKLTGGYVFCIGKVAVSWTSKLQPTVSLSSLKAEYMALTQATKEAIWLRSSHQRSNDLTQG
jgi:hypothetical protein